MMVRFHRIFGRELASPDPRNLLQSLQQQGFTVTATFEADSEGWWRGELTIPGGVCLELERYLASEEGLRAELNSWAGVLETLPADGPRTEVSRQIPLLMERVIQSQQLITLRQPDGLAPNSTLDALCQALCCYLAASTEGFYQTDEVGFFAATGELLVQG